MDTLSQAPFPYHMKFKSNLYPVVHLDQFPCLQYPTSRTSRGLRKAGKQNENAMPSDTYIPKESIHRKARVSTIRPVAPPGEKPAPPPELGLSPPGEELRRWWPAPVVHAANRRTFRVRPYLMDAIRASQCAGVACVPRIYPSAKYKKLERPLWSCVSAIPVRDQSYAQPRCFSRIQSDEMRRRAISPYSLRTRALY